MNTESPEHGVDPVSTSAPDPHLQAVEEAANKFAAAMRAATAAGKRCVVLFEHYTPEKTIKVRGVERTFTNTTGHHVQSPIVVSEAYLVTDDDV